MILQSRLSKSLSVPILQEWAEMLWETGLEQELIALLSTGGDSPAGYWVRINRNSLG